jgi:hypothetical protein
MPRDDLNIAVFSSCKDYSQYHYHATCERHIVYWAEHTSFLTLRVPVPLLVAERHGWYGVERFSILDYVGWQRLVLRLMVIIETIWALASSDLLLQV